MRCWHLKFCATQAQTSQTGCAPMHSLTLADVISVRPSEIHLPRIGWVRLKERGYIPSRAHINSVTISEPNKRFLRLSTSSCRGKNQPPSRLSFDTLRKGKDSTTGSPIVSIEFQ